ncbi:hypothetical protein TNCV_4813911 [Trichonephila clavipes]|nr:hypothetical protein TNCV_4813911 [Trichonephila clavipes]
MVLLPKKIESEDGKTFRWQLGTSSISYPRGTQRISMVSNREYHFGVMKLCTEFESDSAGVKWRAGRGTVANLLGVDARSAGRGQRYVAEGSCIATMLEHPSNVSLSISWDLCQGTASGNKYLLVVAGWTTFTKWPEVYPIPVRSPHRSGGCSAVLDIEIWGTSSTSFRSGKKFRLCGY